MRLGVLRRLYQFGHCSVFRRIQVGLEPTNSRILSDNPGSTARKQMRFGRSFAALSTNSHPVNPSFFGQVTPIGKLLYH